MANDYTNNSNTYEYTREVLYRDDIDEYDDGLVNGGVRASSHTCRLFDVQSFLFDKRWKGSDGVVVQMIDPRMVGQMMDVLQPALEASSIKCKMVAVDGGVGIFNAEYGEHVDPNPLLQLFPNVLWLEPNKLHHLIEANDFIVTHDTCMNEFRSLLESEIEQWAHDQQCVLKVLKERCNENDTTDKSRADRVFQRIEKMKRRLQAVVNDDSVVCIDTCTVCGRIRTVYGDNNVGTDSGIQMLIAKLHDLKMKLADATGSKNQRKRKRLSRKIKSVVTSINAAVSAKNVE